MKKLKEIDVIKNLVLFFKDKEIRNRILFTLGMLLIFQIGTAIPVPGVNAAAITSTVTGNTLFSMMNMIGGGALERFSVLALGVSPYITAGIIIQLLSMDVIPYLSELNKDGFKGRKKMEKITRYLTLVLCFVQAFSMTYAFDKQYAILKVSSFKYYIYVATILTAGSLLLVWIGDRISAYGIGNGISILIFSGIAGNIPSQFMQVFNIFIGSGTERAKIFNGALLFTLYCILYLFILATVVFIEKSERKIPMARTNVSQYGMKENSYLPFKINSASVLPVIFAQSILTAPQLIVSFFNRGWYNKLNSLFDLSKPFGLILYAVLVFGFTFFYTNMQIDTKKLAEDLGKSSSYIPGIRPGQETREYLHKELSRLTFFGAVLLVTIAVIPYLLTMFTELTVATAVGGTGIIIMVGVALETVSQLEGKLNTRSYQFLKW